ncbi:MAG: orotidine-5'-phosphate decarboxylase [Firmicutes bacterium]|nr:orotidine-5'-phosphate decarboxylase [Bacillota bacterium]
MAGEVIIALDFPGKKEALEFLDKFNDEKPFVKIGMELFYAEGPDIVKEIKARGHKIFLDLKLHDIPNTVKSAMTVLGGLDVDMTNVHVAGTKMMMEWALEGLEQGAEGKAEKPLLIAVTQLTSTDEQRMNEDILIPGKIDEVVVKYAEKAKEAGLAGVVCSPLEAGAIKQACGDEFLTVTPGIRFGGAMICDQSRITTPAKARGMGSDYIVMGRPITQAQDPVEAYKRAMKEFAGE